MPHPPRRATALAPILSLLLAVLLPAAGNAQPERVDLATADVVDAAEFRGDAADLLGLHLGMTWEEAKAVCVAHPQLLWSPDTANKGRAYVNDARNDDGGDPALFYLQWPDGRPDMGRMVIYGRAAQFVTGRTAKLLRAVSLAEMDPEVRAWLGTPDRAVVTLNIESIGLKHTTHVFEARAIEVIDHMSDGRQVKVIVALVHPELLQR